jgi:hypothetical protein
MSFQDFRIARNKKLGVYIFSEVFGNLEDCTALWKVFGNRENFLRILEKQKVRVSKKPWIFWVNDKTEEITIFIKYLRECPKKILYLDCIQELVHVTQMHRGKELFDDRFSYVDRPTEIEAYIVTANEAKKIGMNERQIAKYLEVDWVTKEENKRLVKNVLAKMAANENRFKKGKSK